MKVGSLRVRLLVRDSRSLKDKRQVLRSIKDRLRQQLNVAVAEVGAQDNRQVIDLGLATVSEEARSVRTVLEQVVNLLRGHPVAELLDHEIEV